MNAMPFPVLKSHSFIFSFAIILLSSFLQGGCTQTTPAKEAGRWELDAATIAELQSPSPEIPGKLLLYRIDIEEGRLMVRLDVDAIGFGISNHASTFSWRVNDGKFIVKNDTGNELSLDAKILPDGRLEISAHLEPLANMVFKTSDSKQENDRNDMVRKLLNGVEKKMHTPLFFSRKGKAEVGDISSSHTVE